MKLEDLPPLGGALAAHGLLTRKSFGQHFLLDLNLTRKIARLAGPLEGRAVIEVGPGPGGLTRGLLQEGAVVIAIEKDARFLPLLADLAAAADGRLTLIEADALKADEAALLAAHAPGLPAKVVSNLPYNIGAPLLVKWLHQVAMFESLTLMFQKEVAERIVASHGRSNFGRLGVLAQAVTTAEIVMTLPARAFTPPPKVESAVVTLTPRQDRPEPVVLAALERVTQAAFGQRRKMLRSSLRPLGGEALCASMGIDPELRADALPVSAYLDLARKVAAEG
jgi:16S rRNA (adenine1518-N6/adenine1519-N6)-dimethyltransferase